MNSTAAKHAPIGVLVLDDHPIVIEGLRVLLDQQPDLTVVGTALSLDQALANPEKPDVVVADLVLGENRGAEVVSALRSHFDQAAVLVLTMVDDLSEVKNVLRAGARGYLLKESAAADVVDAVRRVARGEEYLQPSVGAALARRTRTEAPPAPGGSLTEREQQVAGLLVVGHTNAEIAAQLCVSIRTVETHRARLFDKLGVRTRAQLVRTAVDSGLVDLFAPHRSSG
jgi:DNA-binding NarL/FixJ family response regulator